MTTQTEQPTALSRERTLDVAEAVSDSDGDAALTFRRLGTDLDADPTIATRITHHPQESR